MTKPMQMLLIEDNPGDVDLVRDTIEHSDLNIHIHVATDGVQALNRLTGDAVEQAILPDIILLDLNLPRLGGRDFLARIKADSRLRSIPVVILTSSEADKDVAESYGLGANCFVTKPVDLKVFQSVVRGIEGFWFDIATLPRQRG
jgi:CheY-like chemotaxis protein